MVTHPPRTPVGDSTASYSHDLMEDLACPHRDHAREEATPHGGVSTFQFLTGYINSLLSIKQHPTGDLVKGKMVIHGGAPTEPGAGPLGSNVDGFPQSQNGLNSTQMEALLQPLALMEVA